MEWSTFFQILVSGIAFGSIYAMVAMGFNIIYNATGIINLAQGEFVMLGGMLLVWGMDQLHLPAWVALLLAVFVVAGVGLLFERLAIRPLKNPSVLTLIIITIAASFIFKGVAMLLWGKEVFSADQFLGSEPFLVMGAAVTRQHVLVLGALIFVSALLAVFFRYTILGKAMRACSFNRAAAQLCGINARSMVLFAFGLSAAIGALAGGVIVPITGVEYDNGGLLGLKGFCAAVLGGLGNNAAALVAGILLGVLEAMAAGYVSSHYKDAIALSLLLIMLFIKPGGLFGKASLSRLSEF